MGAWPFTAVAKEMSLWSSIPYIGARYWPLVNVSEVEETKLAFGRR